MAFVVRLILLVLVSCPVVAQDLSGTKSEAEARLRQMTPEEIERKLRELGMTREEALRLARSQGLSLEEIIQDRQEAIPEDEDRPSRFLVPQRESLRSKVLADSLKEIVTLKKRTVPGFTDRVSMIDTLLPFGYDVFRNRAASFESAQNIATPSSYALGPGDEVTISVWGEARLNYRLVVNRDGEVVVPDVGPVVAAGLSIPQFRERLLRRMSAIYSGLMGGASSANTFLDISLGKLRTLQVFVLGEVDRPGGYPMSSLSTVFQALYEAGGPTVDGTLRQIQIVRGNSSSLTVDLYNYLIAGKVDRDIRLVDGDLVFVKPAGKRVAIQGKVVREAIYEIKQGEALGDLVRMAGGLRFDAYHERIHVERFVPFDERNRFGNDVMDLDVSVATVQELRTSPFELEDGDLVTVEGISKNPINRVQITGNVRKPGVFELSSGMRIRDLVLKADSLDRNTFLEVGTLFRLQKNLRREVYSFNLRRALEQYELDNLPLENEDSVVIYKESRFYPEQIVTIDGGVRKPGSYRRDELMSVGELIVVAGGLREDGLTVGVEVSRMETTSVDVYSQVFKIDLSPDYWEAAVNEPFLLKDHDHIFVPSNPRYSRQKLVSVSGYVMFPGSYSIRNANERLAQIISRAGGLRPGAYLEASRLVRRLNNVGVIPIDFADAIGDPSSRDNIVMNEGDSVHVAFTEDVVYVRGEVIVPTSVLYKRGASLSYYIDQAGGYKEEADNGRTVVILPSGKKWDGDEILPGSSIYVPREIDKPNNTLAIIRDTATILASLAAITIAIVQVTK